MGVFPPICGIALSVIMDLTALWPIEAWLEADGGPPVAPRSGRARGESVGGMRGQWSDPVNKGDLVDAVAAKLSVSKQDAARMVEAVFECLAKGLASSGKVTIAGFGAFNARTRPPRNGVHPITREPMQIAETKTCSFRPAPALKGTL